MKSVVVDVVGGESALILGGTSGFLCPTSVAGKVEHSFEIAREWLEPVKGLGHLGTINYQSWLEEVYPLVI